MSANAEKPERVKIFDTTLRDGEQSPGAAMTHEEKIEVAELLDAVPKPVRQRQKQPVVRHLLQLQRPPHLEVGAAAPRRAGASSGGSGSG